MTQPPAVAAASHSGHPRPPHSGHPWPKHGCDKGKKHEPEHGGDAESGKAKGGDVDQTQSASNDNRTDQAAHAASMAKQEGALNLALVPFPRRPAPEPCEAVLRKEDVKGTR